MYYYSLQIKMGLKKKEKKMYFLTVARQRFRKHIQEAKKTHATIEESLGTSSSRSMSYEGKVGD
jgi:hypothetical protein